MNAGNPGREFGWKDDVTARLPANAELLEAVRKFQSRDR
jgi:hypothetical protein